MNIALAVISALPTVLQLVLAVESMIQGKGLGKVKKDAVMAGIQSGLNVATAAGLKLSGDESKAITEGLSQSVDGLVGVLNTHGWPTAAPTAGSAG
jgi:hypothetical protein